MNADHASWPRVDCCVECGLTAIELPAEHNCRPNLSPEDRAVLHAVGASWDEAFDSSVRPASTDRSSTRGAAPKGSPQARLLGLLRTVNRATAGQRNSTLHWAACRLGEMIAAREIPDARHAVDTLMAVGTAIGLPEREVDATIRSGLAASGVAP